MLSLEGISLRIGDSGQPLLSDVSASFSQGEFVAVIGPSGCGKSTLLKVIAGIAAGEEEGAIRWDGRDFSEEDFKPSEIGYVPQFSIAHEELTVEECVEYSARLRVAELSSEERESLVTRLLAEVGMAEFSERRVKVLSGGQKRRLALAMELVSSPPILLCDEVTSGLDPQSEEEIVTLLRRVARDGNRLVISVTHSLKNLSDYDAVAVLYRGVLAYAGAPSHLSHYFRVEGPELVYPRLPDREPSEWQASWKKHADAFQQGREARVVIEPTSRVRTCPECRAECPDEVKFCKVCGCKVPDDGAGNAVSEGGTPGVISQFITLTERRLKIFFRSHSQLWLQAGLVFGFPAIVSIFGWKGLPQIRNLSMGLDVNVLQQQSEALDFLKQASSVGSLVSGIIMFEVVLLTLMGANNSGREIAGERQIFEKEKLAGLGTGAYLLSKILFLGLLCAVQSLWMGFFIHHTCSFPGELAPQLLFLFLVNAAMTSVCLAISSYMGTAEQASLASIYLVGFQLPLSGAVLALPQWLGTITRPFIAAYWSWSGMLQTLRGERYYDIAAMVIQTTLSAGDLCLMVLLVHIVAGLLLAYQGCQRTRME
ncbi:MAG: ATP-binding cassette domain-containing protein [Proteobacteria bacterium]|nr:ATP-binding cassette domain-containing protein [Pseudomonadota bacterium]